MGIPEYGTGRHEDYLTWLDEERAAAPPAAPCSFACGYEAYGQDLADHERYEHADCPRCGAKAPAADEDGFAYSVTHWADCPRLQPGHRYGPEDAAGEPEGDDRDWDAGGPVDDGLPRVPDGGVHDAGYDPMGGSW